MSIDERLRVGLALNTEHLVADVESELSTTYRRAHRRRLVRRGAVAVVAAAAVAATAWVVDLPSLDSDVAPVVPTPSPTDLHGMQGPLEAGLYSVPVWGMDEAGPYQAVPQPGPSWAPVGDPATRPHEYVRGGTAKLLTLFRPATGQVRAESVEHATNAVLHPWLQRVSAPMLNWALPHLLGSRGECLW